MVNILLLITRWRPCTWVPQVGWTQDGEDREDLAGWDPIPSPWEDIQSCGVGRSSCCHPGGGHRAVSDSCCQSWSQASAVPAALSAEELTDKERQVAAPGAPRGSQGKANGSL
jgi:hypothetical protein